MRTAITGVTSGIGAATAARMKQDGAHITGFDIAEPSENVDQWIKTDMSDPASITNAVDSADGSYDALLNIAGLPPREGQAAKVLVVNYFGLVSFTNGMLSKLNPNASIVNLASRAGSQWQSNLDQVKGLIALDGQSSTQLDAFIDQQNIDYVRSYNLSKEAVIVWTMAQSQRMLDLGMRMNSVSPAAVSTGILDDFKSAFGQKVDDNLKKVGRAGTAEEVAALVAFLARPESHWVKGNDITIDGGMSGLMSSEMLGLNLKYKNN